MNPRDRAIDVLREFVGDVQAACGTGEGGGIDDTELKAEWPDLWVTFNKAVTALRALEPPADPRRVFRPDRTSPDAQQ